MSLIWATRGRTWGFRFLCGGGYPDPLVEYDKAFSGVGDDTRAYCRSGSVVALRFPDPEGRRDSAGRVIPHEFVVQGPVVQTIKSVGDGLDVVWPLVADIYEGVWDSPGPPAVEGQCP